MALNMSMPFFQQLLQSQQPQQNQQPQPQPQQQNGGLGQSLFNYPQLQPILGFGQPAQNHQQSGMPLNINSPIQQQQVPMLDQQAQAQSGGNKSQGLGQSLMAMLFA